MAIRGSQNLIETQIVRQNLREPHRTLKDLSKLLLTLKNPVIITREPRHQNSSTGMRAIRRNHQVPLNDVGKGQFFLLHEK